MNNDIDVPGKIAILGVDSNELIANSLQVPLSSVNHDVERLGYEGAAELLHRLLLGEETPPAINLSYPKVLPPAKAPIV